jgi:hypothetical protein
LVWRLVLGPQTERADERLARPVFERCTNRRSDGPAEIDLARLQGLESGWLGLDVHLVREPRSRVALGEALGELDRILFLSPRFHREVVGEIRWTAEEAERLGDGIDLPSLELARTELATLRLLRSTEMLAFLRKHGLGKGLARRSANAFRHAPAAAVLSCRGSDRHELVAAGRGLQQLWMECTRRGIGVQPWGTPFILQRLGEAPESLDAWERETAEGASKAFFGLLPELREKTVLLVLRLHLAPPPTSRSLRRPTAHSLEVARQLDRPLTFQ